MGACTARWDTRYLEDKIGAATVISIHKGSSKYLQFSTKNFVYQTVPFSQFRAHLEQNDHVYLRSLAARSPFRKAADFWTDFPGLAVDFTLPAQLSTICDLPANLHSSVLRVSGNVAIWLHYDVMSNFLFQARGSKTVVLFQPEDATRLDFAPGSTVSSTCLETIAKSALDRTPADPPPSVNGCAAKVVRLRAGDVLFIPRFCPHATFPAPGDDAAAAVSVAVNVFWRDLPRAAYAAGRDVYGSRDLAAYGAGRDAVGRLAARVVAEAGAGEQAREQAGLLAEGLRTGRREAGTPPAGWAEVCSVRNRVACLPEDVGKFYLPRLAGELVALVEEKLSGNETA
jgi:tRNA wybutosine-synthesizing protein 4